MLDSLGSARDAVWPGGRWPVLTLDRPLQVGAVGGHGPIRFRFLSPEGFVGTHGFDVEDALEKVEGAFHDVVPPRAWSRQVVFLRWLVRKNRRNRRRK